MSVKSINVAIAGAGFMGTAHLRAFLEIPDVKVVAICSPNRPVVNGVLRGVAGNIQQTSAVRLAKGTIVVRRFEELLAMPEVDAVDICSPTALHRAQSIAALRAGKHVLCEKPVAESAAQAREVMHAAARAKGIFMPAMCIRFWPGWSWFKQVVAEEIHGKVLAVGFRRVSGRPNWGDAASHPGGALLDLHIHDTDFVHFLFGRPDKVFSSGVMARNGAIEHVVSQYSFARGPVVYAEGSWLSSGGFNMAFTAQCEHATIDYDFQREAEALRVSVRGGPFRAVKIAMMDGYRVEIRHFIDCIRRGRPSPVVTAQDAVDVLEICEAEEKSARSGKAVKP